jgi:hypothetical protein
MVMLAFVSDEIGWIRNHRRANGDLRTGSEAEALLLSPKPSSVIWRKANIRRKRKGTLFKYKDFIDTVLNAFKPGFISSQTFCRGFTITPNRFKKPFVKI